MDRYRSRRRHLAVALTLVALTTSGATHADIELEFDVSPARAVVSLLIGPEVRSEELAEIMDLPGIVGMIRKVESLDPRGDAAALRRSLEATSKGQTIENDPYRLAAVREHLDVIRPSVDELAHEAERLATSVAFEIGAYAPPDLEARVKVVVVAGSNSCGWTTDDDSLLYVDVRCTRDDRRGLELLVAHEVYHLVQLRFLSPPTEGLDDRLARVEMIQRKMIEEGGASHVADFSKAPSEGSYVRFSQDEYERNRRRIGDSFALFQALVQYADRDVAADGNDLYRLGFTGYWDSPLYFVGQEMSRRVEAELGRKALVELWSGPPEGFALAYASLPSTAKDPALTLSPTTVAVLRKLTEARVRLVAP